MFNAENLQEKWAPVLNHDGLPEIKDNYRKAVTAILLENQEKQLREERAILTEAPTNVGPINTQTTGTGAVDGFDPILISLIRRAMPSSIAYDIAGVQPMNGPTGLIFAMRSHYTNQTGNEAFFNEPDAQFSGTDGAHLQLPQLRTILRSSTMQLAAVLPRATMTSHPPSSPPLRWKLWATVLTPRSWRWHSASIVLP